MAHKKTVLIFKLNKELIERTMDRYNLSIEAISYFSGIGFGRLLNILCGKSAINISELVILADILKLPITSLMLLEK